MKSIMTLNWSIITRVESDNNASKMLYHVWILWPHLLRKLLTFFPSGCLCMLLNSPIFLKTWIVDFQSCIIQFGLNKVLIVHGEFLQMHDEVHCKSFHIFSHTLFVSFTPSVFCASSIFLLGHLEASYPWVEQTQQLISTCSLPSLSGLATGPKLKFLSFCPAVSMPHFNIASCLTSNHPGWQLPSLQCPGTSCLPKCMCWKMIFAGHYIFSCQCILRALVSPFDLCFGLCFITH